MIASLILAVAFEKIALVDSLDFARLRDVETEKGTIEVLDWVCASHPTAIAWRDRSGGLTRFASAEEPSASVAASLDKRYLPREDAWGWLKMANPALDAYKVVFEECDRRGLVRAIHNDFEEFHWGLTSLWNYEHPQFWCKPYGANRWAGHCSLAYPEVRAHKLRYLDELLAKKPSLVFLDMWRAGQWSPAVEYVWPNLEKWRARYGAEPVPKDPTNPRWLDLIGENVEGYLRAYSAKCRAAGARLVIGFKEFDVGEKLIRETYAIDWKKLAAEKVFDGFAVMGVPPNAEDPFGAIRRALDYARENLSGTPLYSAVSMYNMRKVGIPELRRLTKLSNGEIAKRLIALAKEAGCAGVVMECVDGGNYPADVNDALIKGEKDN